MLKQIQDCFKAEKVLYTKHARDEKETVYQPDPDKWIDFERRKL